MNGQILINKNNLTHNLSEIQKYAKDSKIMSVIKSNGYGHGILEVASALKNQMHLQWQQLMKPFI